MAILEILQYPDPRLLHARAERVEKIDADDAQARRRHGAETMYAAPGVGLAATQVDVHKQIIVIDVSEDRSDLRVFINPEITRREGRRGEPGRLPLRAGHLRQRASAPRASPSRRSTATARGSPSNASGLLAACIQHEMDHLQGKVFVDYLSELKQNRIRAKLKKRQRKAA
mgnify:CR=1 FL=1